MAATRRYTGQQLDEDIGLYYYGSRYYDPELARFIQPDSIIPGSSSQFLNRYTYCNNNPLLFVDPSGHSIIATIIIGAIIGAAVGGAMAAAQGGNIWKGALAGAIAGAFGGYGWATFGVSGNFIGLAMCSAAGGALGALVTGGDPGMAAATAAISSTVSFGLFSEGGIFGSFSGSITEQHIKLLMVSTGVGALMGGISAEIFGGDFGEGAMWGAASAAASSMLSSALNESSHDSTNTNSVDKQMNLLAGFIKGTFGGIGHLISRLYGGIQLLFQKSLEILTFRKPPWTKQYTSQDTAATAALKNINPRSMFENREYGGLVNRNANGSFTPTKPIRGTVASLRIPPPTANTTAYYHTHGAYDPKYMNEVFSTIPGDIFVAISNNIDAYLMTPGGKIRHYNVATGRPRRLQ